MLWIGTLTCYAEELSLGGLAVDHTISRIGHLFYDALVDNWEIPENMGIISVHERPNAFTGNIISVEIDGVIIFQSRMGTRAIGIEEKALLVRQAIIEYNAQLQQNTL
jgi:curli production assembly/transport component CsgE